MPLNDRSKLTGEVAVSQETFQEYKRQIASIQDLKSFLENQDVQDITKTTSQLLCSAVILEASDVHIEPQEHNAKVRLRLDGLLQDAAAIPAPLYAALLSRIKLASGLKLNVEDRPQDGRLSLSIEGGSPIEIRTSTLPSEYGETIVMRVLNPKRLIALQDLGLRKDLVTLFIKELKKPNGMVAVTGPTGSGKTTTLYAFLKEVQKPEIKIVTIEDPIEYHLEGISQTQAHPEKGYDFASGLRAIVRQDPDVILVGEIRDGETAQIALQSALTGHLVFSTLHTNDAAGTVARLESLGAEPNNISSALNIIIAQRLVRKICKTCGASSEATPKEAEKIQRAISSLPKAMKPSFSKTAQLKKAKGCKACNGTGYKGRMGIFEAMEIAEETEKFILTSPSTSSLKEFAIQHGMITMLQDGILKVLEGVTTLEEVERVTEE
ncbi:MAG: type II/IV secretion system protein [Candidatus Wildermuthbacteria bacterium]|nr:type II/IV secretion system protein [Candidatus Wildermuthbacteria bacterium]